MNPEGMLPLFALMVKPRHEKWIAAALEGKGYTNYLPLQRQFRRYSGRNRTVDLPLFPSYVFARFDPQRRLPILTIPGVFFVIGNHSGPIAVDETEFASVCQICLSAADIEECPFGEPGEQVIVTSGPLAGVTGTIVNRKNRARLVVSITIMKRAISVELDAATVLPVDGFRFSGTLRRGVAPCELHQNSAQVA